MFFCIVSLPQNKHTPLGRCQEQSDPKGWEWQHIYPPQFNGNGIEKSLRDAFQEFHGRDTVQLKQQNPFRCGKEMSSKGTVQFSSWVSFPVEATVDGNTI